jgi:hypothetical protein
MAACSGAKIEQLSSTVRTVPTSAVSATPYDVREKLRLVFRTGAGAPVEIRVPAPHTACFLADGVTPDTSNPQVAALIAAAITYLTSTAGVPAATYAWGRRTSQRLT